MTAESILAWRLTSRAYTGTAFDGEGAQHYGGRWNSPGRPMVYLAGSLALAALEQLAHLHAADLLEKQFVRFRAVFPSETLLELDEQVLPDDWTKDLETTRRIGDGWLETGASLALKVPSAVVTEEHNYVLNPGHPDFSRLDISPAAPFTFDWRLVTGW